MDLPENKSSKSKIVWIVIGVVIAFAVLGGSVYAIIRATMPKQVQTTSQTNKQKTVTDEQLRLGLDKLNTTIDKEKTDRASAQQALDDQVKRIKLSN